MVRNKHLRALITTAALAVAAITGSTPTWAADEFITVTSTTSTQNSGLFDAILPKFEDKTGIEVRVVAVGTGQAIRNAKNGDADVLFVHHRPSEEAFVAEGHGVERHDVMMNDFVIIGPAADPVDAADAEAASGALADIAEARHPFVSRGDDSGTHKMERDLWDAAGTDPTAASGTWYREAGAGMGATLNMARAMGAYALSDRGTWISFQNKGDLKIVFEGDDGLTNPYGVILVNPERFPHVKADAGQAFIDWLISDEGQAAIAAYRVNGEQLFFPTAQ